MRLATGQLRTRADPFSVTQGNEAHPRRHHASSRSPCGPPKGTEDEAQPEPISLPFVWQPQGRRKGIVHEPNRKERHAPKASQVILTAIGKARRWMNELFDSSFTIDDIASREGMGDRNLRRLLGLSASPRFSSRWVRDQAPPHQPGAAPIKLSR